MKKNERKRWTRKIYRERDKYDLTYNFKIYSLWHYHNLHTMASLTIFLINMLNSWKLLIT